MTLRRYFVVPAYGAFHVAYAIEGTTFAHSVLDCPTREVAAREVDAMNREAEAEIEPVYVPPEERGIVPGFYNEQMDLI